MTIITESIPLETGGNTDIIDITPQVAGLVTRSGLSEGQVLIFVPGSTGALTTVEYEPGLRQDIPELLEKLIPSNVPYKHDLTWHDGNGHAHLRASLIGPSLAVPFSHGKLLLGTWQQIIFLDFDNRPRSRKLVAQLTGEA